MEQVLGKLAEIETAASYIMEEAVKTKQNLSLEMEAQYRTFDEMVDANTSKRVSAIRKQLEKDKETELAALKEKTTGLFSSMNSYYEENHSRLVQELYDKILKD